MMHKNNQQNYTYVIRHPMDYSSNLRTLLHTCYSYNFDYLLHSKFRCYKIIFLVKYTFSLPKLRFLSAKLPSVTQRSVSREKSFKKSKHPSPFPRKTKGLNNPFTLIETIIFQVVRIAKFEFKVTVQYGLWENASGCAPLNSVPLCYAMLCHVMSCHVMSCHVMSCYVFVWFCEILEYIPSCTVFPLYILMIINRKVE